MMNCGTLVQFERRVETCKVGFLYDGEVGTSCQFVDCLGMVVEPQITLWYCCCGTCGVPLIVGGRFVVVGGVYHIL